MSLLTTVWVGTLWKEDGRITILGWTCDCTGGSEKRMGCDNNTGVLATDRDESS